MQDELDFLPPADILETFMANQGSGSMPTKNALLHRMNCTAHKIQLSIRSALNESEIESLLNSVRQTCRFFRKSSSGALFLERRQMQGGGI